MKKISKILTIVIIMFILCGCNNYQEINNYAIVSGISIDADDKDPSKYQVGVQIMNAKKEEESENSLITFYKSTGDTLYEALSKIMLDSPKELYLGHTEIVIISDDLLRKKDPLNYLDYFMRDAEVEKDPLLMIAKDDPAYDVLKIITPLETIPTRNIKSTISVANNFSGSIAMVTLDQFLSDLINDGREPILPSITITGNVKKGEKMDNIAESDPNTKVKFNTLGYFKNNKLKGYLTNDESVGYVFLANIQKENFVNVKCDDKNFASIRISKSSVEDKISFENGKPKVEVSFNVKAKLLEYNCKADFVKDDKAVRELAKKAEDKIIKLAKKTTDKLYREENTDALKYGAKFYQQKYKEMKKYGYKINEIANDITFDFKSKVSIESTELSIKSVKEDK
ncbi:MAG: Ger(x)C family spore germination protein [Bacilli bacterium]|nr:Ger(x)C family spore germination protein [Bacilli bacterium]